MRHPYVLAITALIGAGLIGAGCGSSATGSNNGGGGAYPAASSAAPASAAAARTAASAASASHGGSATAIGTVHTGLGTILVAGPEHRTVYLFAADHGSTSTCAQTCAQVWPPVTTTGDPRAEGAAKAANLGTTTRADGTKQLTYNGHPLYYYVSDQSSGQTTGEGVNSFGAPWYVLNPDGKQIGNP